MEALQKTVEAQAADLAAARAAATAAQKDAAVAAAIAARDVATAAADASTHSKAEGRLCTKLKDAQVGWLTASVGLAMRSWMKCARH